MKFFLAIVLSVQAFCSAKTHALTIDTVVIGNVNNTPHVNGFGAVNYPYRIGTTEVTNTQYTEFLNAVAATDTYKLYNPRMGSQPWGGIDRSGSPGSYVYTVKPDVGGYSYGEKPVIYTSFLDAIRFANWLHNGQGNGGTENGAYALDAPSNADITRKSNARWFIPSEDEWFKAAYHKNDGDTGNYYFYPTSSNRRPDNNFPTHDSGNSANFRGEPFGPQSSYTTGSSEYPFTDVGAYTLSVSPYGTFDQGGNVGEWTDSVDANTLRRVFRGGNAGDGISLLASSSRLLNSGGTGGFASGFRVATIPESSSLLIAALSSIGLFTLKRELISDAR